MSRRKPSAEEEAALIAGPRRFGAAAIALHTGISKTTVFAAMDEGKLKCTWFGSRRLSTQAEIDAWIASLPTTATRNKVAVLRAERVISLNARRASAG